MTKEILMFSGGIDSLIAYYFLGKPRCVYVNLSLPYSIKEMRAVRSIGIEVEIINLSPAGHHPLSPSIGDPFIPSRNLLLATIGTWLGEKICIAGIKDDNVEDKTPSAYEEMSRILTMFSRKEVNVFSPFWQMTKSDIVRWFVNNAGDEQLLHLSKSCYSDTLHQCGDCGSCLRKWVALKANKIEPTFKLSEKIINAYSNRARAGRYAEERNEEILSVIDD